MRRKNKGYKRYISYLEITVRAHARGRGGVRPRDPKFDPEDLLSIVEYVCAARGWKIVKEE